MADAVVLTPKTAAALEILRETGAKMFADEIAEVNPELFAKGAASVSPIMTNLHRKGLVAKEKAVREVISKDGNKVSKELTRYWVTEDGLALEYTVQSAE